MPTTTVLHLQRHARYYLALLLTSLLGLGVWLPSRTQAPAANAGLAGFQRAAPGRLASK